MENALLNKLVESGCINSYEYIQLDENGVPGRGKFRNTEQLKLVFPNQETLVIDTFCSGCAENTTLSFRGQNTADNAQNS